VITLDYDTPAMLMAPVAEVESLRTARLVARQGAALDGPGGTLARPHPAPVAAGCLALVLLPSSAGARCDRIVCQPCPVPEVLPPRWHGARGCARARPARCAGADARGGRAQELVPTGGNASASGMRQVELDITFGVAARAGASGDQRFDVGVLVETGGSARSRIGVAGTLRPAAGRRYVSVTQARRRRAPACRHGAARAVHLMRAHVMALRAGRARRRRCTQTTRARAAPLWCWTSGGTSRSPPAASASTACPCASLWTAR